MRTSNCKAEALSLKGHSYGPSPLVARYLKRQARRAQRRDNHKEIEAQFQDEYPIPMNIYAPVPVFLMDDWERAGMEYFRQMKSISAMTKKRGGPLAWRRQSHLQAQAKALSRYDETLFRDLEASYDHFLKNRS